MCPQPGNRSAPSYMRNAWAKPHSRLKALEPARLLHDPRRNQRGIRGMCRAGPARSARYARLNHTH